MREAYFEFEYKNTFVRLGKQQIVWGKTDAFRLQDKINPIDFGYHNVFPDLEERRIPQLALDVIHSFGDVGPFQDVSVELAWVFDRFIPAQVGQEWLEKLFLLRRLGAAGPSWRPASWG